MSKVAKGLTFAVSFGASFTYGVHLSQTYDLPDMMRSAGAVARWFTGEGMVPRKRRRDDDDDDDKK